MREQTRSYTTALPCIGLKFLASIRRSLEHAALGTRLHADTDSGRFYIIRQAYDYAITTGSRTQPLRLTSTRAGYGVRYSYLCPHCAKRCAKLYIGLQDAGCCQCCSLHYASQSENAENRMMRAIRRKRLALWGASEPYHELMNLGMSPGMFFKPKGMHWKTFERKHGELVEFEHLFWRAKQLILARRFPGFFLWGEILDRPGQNAPVRKSVLRVSRGVQRDFTA